MAAMKLGRRISESGGTLPDTLVGGTILNTGARAAAWAGQQAPDAATARRLVADLLALEDSGATYQRALEGEFYFTRRNLEAFRAGGDALKQAFVELHVVMDSLNQSLKPFDVFKGKIFGPGDALPELPEIPAYPYEENKSKWLKEPPPEVLRQIEQAKATDWDKKMRAAAEAFRRARLIKPTTWAEWKKMRSPARDSDGKSVPTEDGEFEDVADMLCSTIIRNTARIRLARVSLLVRAWMYEHTGEPPDNLDALVPDLLPALPMDPFDGKPLRYDRQKLWCVEADLSDNAGENDGGGGDDLVQPL
jgi:hypothetical protein